MSLPRMREPERILARGRFRQEPDVLLTPAGTFSAKIATLGSTFPARNLTEKRHQVSVDHYTATPRTSGDLRGERRGGPPFTCGPPVREGLSRALQSTMSANPRHSSRIGLLIGVKQPIVTMYVY